MANVMTTFVKIKNLNEETHSKLVDLFQTKGDRFDENDLLPHFNKLYEREFNDTDNFYGVSFMLDNVGSKWLSVEFGGWSTENFVKEEDEVDLILESAWSVPTLYLERLRDVLTDINQDIVIYGTYEDESYNPMGAFIYAYDYEDIEDYDEEVEFDAMLEDDDYKYQIMGDIRDLRDAMFDNYLEVKSEREEEDENS